MKAGNRLAATTGGGQKENKRACREWLLHMK
jgi:hypothetical protein